MNRVKFLAGRYPGAGPLSLPFWITALVIFCFFSNASCQTARIDSSTATDPYELLFTIPVQAKNFTTDKLQHLYLLTPDNEVIKFTPEGLEQYRYPNKTLGDAAFIDATNPFLLLLFFPDYQTIVTLDRTLTMSGQYNLQNFGLFRVHAAGMAGDGNLWVYDEVNFRLKKIRLDGTVVTEGGDLSLILGKTVSPNFLREKDQLVYLNDPNEGVLVFDVFGQYQKTLPIKGLESFQIVDDQLIYLSKEGLYSFHLKSLLETPVRMPERTEAGERVSVQNDRLFILENGKVSVYKL